MKPITETCRPRDDVVEGKLADFHFAAQLDQLVRNPGGYPVYGDAEQFFELTYPTTGLKRLLQRSFGRLSGAKVAGAEHGVIRSETSFGGGKTHGLMAVYHLAKGARPTNIGEFIDVELLPPDCQIAAVVADTLDPASGLETHGLRTYTIWGEIAAQLGAGAYAQVKANDEQRTAPGKVTWEAAFGDRPTIVIIDELASHLRQLVASGDPETRRMAQAIPTFLKNLFELAAASPRVVVIITLATTANAFGKETDELSAMLDETGGDYREVLADTQSIAGRVGTIVRPAEDAEIGEILKRRLFDQIDSQAASVAGVAYRALYERLARAGEELSGGADAPATYGAAVAAAYPFHPELIRVLDKRIGTIASFQRTRGALRLLAEVIAGVWHDNTMCDVINVADIDLGRADVRVALTTGLGRPEFDGVALADLAGPSSHAAALDATRFAGRPRYATRAARTVFLHSLELTAQAGAGRNDYLLGTLTDEDEPTIIGEALAELEKTAWYLSFDTSRWRFVTEPQPAKIIEDEARNIPQTTVRQELDDLIARVFPTDGEVRAIHFPHGVADVPDDRQLRLVVLHYNDMGVVPANATPPPARLVEMLDKAGVGEGIRAYRNSVVFLVADSDLLETMRERVRQLLAVEKIVDDGARMQGFAEPVRKRLTNMAHASKLQTRIAITRCYKHLYYPKTDRANSHLRHSELTPKSQGEADKPQTRVILQALRDEGKVRSDRLATDYLKSKTWPASVGEVTTLGVADWFWRDHGAPLLLDQTLLRDALRDGIINGTWVLHDAQAQRTWTAHDSAAHVEFSADQVLYAPERAQELGLLGRDPRVDDVTAALTDGQLKGAGLRVALEQAVGREPRKGEVTEVLARAAEGGQHAKVVVVAGAVEPGVKAATPAEIRKGPLDSFTVLAPGEAQRLSIARGEARELKPAEAHGVAGVAFQALSDQVMDSSTRGITSLSITTSADPGEGARDLALLGKAIGQLPKHEITIELDVALDFAGLQNGAEVQLRGPAHNYQGIEDSFLAFAKTAKECSGTLRLDVAFPEPCPANGAPFEQLRRVLVALSPGELKLRAVLAP
ncbi:MAG: DUF499 domain-containing protein [Solirubrobacteraceae bacterium]